jgi:hypothetical protein
LRPFETREKVLSSVFGAVNDHRMPAWVNYTVLVDKSNLSQVRLDAEDVFEGQTRL